MPIMIILLSRKFWESPSRFMPQILLENSKIKCYLLGSTVDREASQKEREKDQPTFKDNDFLKDGVKIHIGEEAKAKLMETLKG